MVEEDALHHTVLEDDEWRGMKKCCPIISGGLNPLKLAPFVKAIGHVDFITTMGGGVHAHPDGTTAGAKAQSQAGEALQK